MSMSGPGSFSLTFYQGDLSRWSDPLPPSGGGGSPRWSYLIPAIGTLAFHAKYFPKVPTGITIAAAYFTGVLATAHVLRHYKLLIRSDRATTLDEYYENHPIQTTVLIPIVHEIIFRDFLQPKVAEIISSTFPATARQCLKTSFSRATLISIVGMATLQGLAQHCSNPNGSLFPPINKTCREILYGVTAAKFGVPSAVAAHIAYNTSTTTYQRSMEWIQEKDSNGE